MDNITHTLAGLAVAEVALAVRRRKDATPVGLVRAAWLGSALASNVPDVDFAYAGITSAPLGYLLHHRGHTHTLALAPLVALAPFAIARVMQRRWGDAPSRASDGFLYLLCVLGVVLHVLLDFGNSYGVHPFWPLSNAWLYGDTIFIVEPAWWITLAIPLALSTTPRAGRFTLLGIAALGVGLAAITGYVSSLAVAGLSLLCLGIYSVGRRLETDGGRASLAIGGALAVVLAFSSGHALAEPRARAALDGAFPDGNEVDLVMSPEPGNPLCWNVLAVAVERDETLVLRRLVVSAIPVIHPAALCRMVPGPETTADDEEIARPGHDDVRFFTETRTSLSTLRDARGRCDGEAFLRFARAPFLAESEGERVLGDYRFDRETGRSFSEMVLPEPLGDCPTFLPPWGLPRADVLDGTYAPEVHEVDRFDVY